MRPKLRYPSSLISLPLSLIFSNLPPLSVVVVAFGLPFVSLTFDGSASVVVAKDVAVPILVADGAAVPILESSEFCFLLFKSPKRRGLGDIDRRCKLGDANKLFSDD